MINHTQTKRHRGLQKCHHSRGTPVLFMVERLCFVKFIFEENNPLVTYSLCAGTCKIQPKLSEMDAGGAETLP